MKWFILAVCTLIVFTLVALTAIDKNNEQSCQRRDDASRSLYTHDCNGFLPW